MIQRIQSIFIFFYIISTIMSYYISSDIIFNPIEIDFNLSKILFIINLFIGVSGFFLYKYRSKQILILKTGVLIQIIFLILGAFGFISINNKFFVMDNLWIIICLINLYFLFYAIKYINKDIRLLDSINRIR